MWIPLTNCSQQLKIHSKVRENTGQYAILYDVIEIEFDQYKLAILSKDDVPVTVSDHNVLTCEQLLHYNFEVDDSAATKL
jgi:hypothetical protein